MPPRVERREPGVYLITWEGVIRRDQLLAFSRVREMLFDRYGDERYVLIMDMSKATIREYDIRTTRQAIEDSRLLAVFVINASLVFLTLIHMLRQLTEVIIDACDSYEEAVERARKLLAR
jgi:hypothetical protein